MKIYFSFFTAALVMLASVISYSQNAPPVKSVTQEQIVETLIMGMNTCNKGLCAGCTYMAGELCCEKSVIPLMSILHNAPCEELRILAALSLTKIGDARGIYAVKRAIEFDDSERVQRMCSIFYRAYAAGKLTNDSSIKLENLIAGTK
jgi:hypothetical protein